MEDDQSDEEVCRVAASDASLLVLLRVAIEQKQTEKLSCFREAVRRCVLSKIWLIHSRSLKVIRSYIVEYGVCKFVFRVSIQLQLGLCIYLVPFPRYSTSNNGAHRNLGERSFKVIENGTIRQTAY